MTRIEGMGDLANPSVKPGILSRAWGNTVRSRPASTAALCSLAAAGLLLPWGSPVFLVIGAALAWKRRKYLRSWPMAVPMDSGVPDPRNPHPASGKPMPGKGIALIGHDRNGRECWMTADDLKQHMLVLGCTGAGKTELLLGLCANALSAGSGFTYIDAKGDVSIFAKVSELCARTGRSSDLLVLNFMNGISDPDVYAGISGLLRTNTLNPFATGSADGLVQLLVSLMPEWGGDGSMWKGRAVGMLSGVLRALVWMRDQGELELNVGTIREHISIKQIIEMAESSEYSGMPEAIRRSLQAYLSSLPGYRKEGGLAQAQTTLDQHGYLELQFSQILGSLADVYGHIFRNAQGNVDMDDVVLNKRILLVMLPALEKSPDELSNLGKIVVASLKGMMGRTLGSNLEGSWEDVVERRGPTSMFPYLCVFDDAGYYMVEGMSLMAAQARSLGFSMVYASQDIPSLKRCNEKEAASIIANTNTKIFMRTEDLDNMGSLVSRGGSNKSEERMNFSDENRINFSDLVGQDSGDITVLYQGDVIRAKTFYTGTGGGERRRKLLSRLRLRANTPVPLLPPAPHDEIIRDNEEKVAASIAANTSTKVFMRTEDETGSLPIRGSGEEELPKSHEEQ